MAGRWRPSPPAAKPSIWKASVRPSTGSIRSQASTSMRSGARSATRPPASCSSRSWARVACARSPIASCRILRALCDEKGILLVLDEVQIGRWPHRAASMPMNGPSITPDIMASAKGLGGGFPVGACLTTEAVGQAMTAGDARLDIRRQPAGHGGRQCRARRGSRARLSRTCRANGPEVEAAARRPCRRAQRDHRRGAGPGAHDGTEVQAPRTPSSLPRCASGAC